MVLTRKCNAMLSLDVELAGGNTICAGACALSRFMLSDDRQQHLRSLTVHRVQHGDRKVLAHKTVYLKPPV
jgi:hypothetical protein